MPTQLRKSVPVGSLIRSLVLLLAMMLGATAYAAPPTFDPVPQSPAVGTWVDLHVGDGPSVRVLVAAPGIAIFPGRIAYDDGLSYFDAAVPRLAEEPSDPDYIADMRVLFDRVVQTPVGARVMTFLATNFALPAAEGGAWGAPGSIFLDSNGRNSGINLVVGQPPATAALMRTVRILGADQSMHGRGSAALLAFGMPRASTARIDFSGNHYLRLSDVALFHEFLHVVHALGGYNQDGNMNLDIPLGGSRAGQFESVNFPREEAVTVGAPLELAAAYGYRRVGDHVIIDVDRAQERAVNFADDLAETIRANGGATAVVEQISHSANARAGMEFVTEATYSAQRSLNPADHYVVSSANADGQSVYEVIDFTVDGLGNITAANQTDPDNSPRLRELSLVYFAPTCNDPNDQPSDSCGGGQSLGFVSDAERQLIADSQLPMVRPSVDYHRIQPTDDVFATKVLEAGPTAGALVAIANYAGDGSYRPTQQWRKLTGAFSDGAVQWQMRNTQLCLSVNSESKLDVEQCAATSRQAWVQRSGGQWYNNGTAKCMDVISENTYEGAEVGVYDCKDPGSDPWNQVFAPARLTAGAALPRSNLARYTTMAQSSNYFSDRAFASAAADGNTDGNFSAGSVTHTGDDANAWILAELEMLLPVHAVILYPREDCCQDRLSDYWIFASDTPLDPKIAPAEQAQKTGVFARHVQHTLNAPTVFALPEGTQAVHVMVQLAGRGALSLAEMEIVPAGGILDVQLSSSGKAVYINRDGRLAALEGVTPRKFNLIEKGDGTFLLRNGSRCEVGVEDGYVVPGYCDDWLGWKADGREIKSMDGGDKCLDVSGAPSRDREGELIVYDCHGGWNQRWDIQQVGDSR